MTWNRLRRLIGISAPAPSPARYRRRRRRLRMEALEDRRLLAVADLGGAWVEGTPSESPAWEQLAGEGEGEETVARFRLETTDLAGNPITQVTQGEEFDLRVFVEDVRAVPRGVFSPYLDVTYGSGQITTDGNLNFGAIYTNLPSGDTSTDGLVDEGGAFAGLAELGGGEFLVYSLRFSAVGGGTVNFAADPADDSPAHDVLVYGSIDPLLEAEMEFVGTSLSISDVQILDNGSPGFSTVGNWSNPTGIGYLGDIHHSAAGSGADVASWSFNVSSGLYRVSATWNPTPNRATNSPFTILDGSTSQGTVQVNQEELQNDRTDAGATWQDLGEFEIFGNQLVVQLSDNANEYVIADGVRIERIGDIVQAPEIQVLDGTTDIADNTGSVNFGNTPPGTPVTKTFTVRNAGSQQLDLIGPINLPSGFSLAAGFSSTQLAPGGSATFSVQLDAASEGSFQGSLSFGNNDSNENPFNFTISGTVATGPMIQILDNGSPGFSTVGSWSHPTGIGYLNDIHHSAAGSGADVASWSFNVSSGLYRVSATWNSTPNRATNSPFTILDGSTPQGTVQVNQEELQNDRTDAGATWQDLGEFEIFGNQLVVQLSDNANEYVIADGVRIERIGDIVQAPEIQVLDGTTDIADNTGSVNFGNTPPGTPVTKTFTVRNAGSQQLDLIGPINLPSGFSLAAGFGSTQLAPGGSATFSVQLDAASEGSFQGSLSFGNNDSNENPFNFTISGTVATGPMIQILDNGSPGFSTVGSWSHPTGIGYLNDIHHSAAGSGADVASWSFNVSSGLYRVSATWNSTPNRATNSPFTILDGSTPQGTVQVNQEELQNDRTDAGATWQDLGEFEIFGNQLVVQLSDNANEYVIADGVRIERIGDIVQAPEIQVLDGTTDIADNTGSVNFGNTPPGTPVTKTFTVRNAGSQQLDLIGPINLPSGFSLAAGFSSTQLAPGGSATFSVQLDAASEGSFQGSLSFGNNDSNENPFNFTISGTVATGPMIQILDNGSPGFSTVGNWSNPTGIGYLGDIHHSAAGSGADVASWSFNVSSGLYRVSATWNPTPNRATNSPFTILDGSTPQGTVQVNQEELQNDRTDAGATWQDLGEFEIFGNQLVVQLSDNANEYVIADGVRIERIGDIVQAPEIQVLDGTTDIADNTGSVNFGNTPPGTPVTKTFTVRNAGSQQLDLIGPINLPSGFSLAAGFSSTQLAPGGSATFSVQLDAASEGSFQGSLSFGNNDSNENPFNFTISGTVATGPMIQILDNGSPGFSTVGSWSHPTGIGYLNDIHHSAAGSGADVASWSFNVSSGLYRVSATWNSTPNRATNSPFTILDGSTPRGTVLVNQEELQNDRTDAGATWQDLGEFEIFGNQLVVQLSDNANEYVIADGVRIERIDDV